MATATTPSKKRYNAEAVRQHNERHQRSHNFYGCMMQGVRQRIYVYLDDVLSDTWPVYIRRRSYRHLHAEKKFYRSLINLMRQGDRVLPLP